MNQAKNWLVPLIISGLIFVAVRPAFAQIIEGQANLAQYLTANNVEVGSEAGNNGFRQVYYVWNGQKNFITNGQYTSANPVTKGEYIVWMSQINGSWQIFLYNIPSGETVQLTNTGNNVNPKIDKGIVVWEGGVNLPAGEASWQIFFFDGTKVVQLTSGDLSLNPDIEGDYISYGRRDITGTWRSVVYSISKNQVQEVTTGISSKKPKVKGNKIILAGTGVEEEFSLTIDDLFLLNLVPLSATSSASPSASPTREPAPQTITKEEIRQELQATESAIPQASPSPPATTP